MGTPSRLADLLGEGHFVLTAELSSSNSPDPEATWRRAEVLRGSVDAINCTDNTGAHVHMSSLAAAHLLVEKGFEPVMQLTVRDRNRLALQADLLGAAALGVRNLVLMSGDDVTAGDHPEARRIYDIDSIQLLEVAAGMRDRGTYLPRPFSLAPSRIHSHRHWSSAHCACKRRCGPAPTSFKPNWYSMCRSSPASWRWSPTSA